MRIGGADREVFWCGGSDSIESILASVNIFDILVLDRASVPLAQQVEAGVPNHGEEPSAGVRPVHLVEGHKRLQAGILNRVPSPNVVTGDPPRQVVG